MRLTFNVGQLRVDSWNHLKKETAELDRCHKGSANEKQHILQVKSILKDLNGIEKYFGFPGVRRVDQMEASLSRREHRALANKAEDLTRQLISDSYRGNPDFILEDEVIHGRG